VLLVCHKSQCVTMCHNGGNQQWCMHVVAMVLQRTAVSLVSLEYNRTGIFTLSCSRLELHAWCQAPLAWSLTAATLAWLP
jgi:hypothetical protein